MKILLLNQCFYPDVVSTGQHLTDLAVKLAEHGHSVTVVASSRGYDNPEIRFPKRETWRNVDIIRLPALGLGKKAKWRRALDFGSYLLNCIWRLIFLPKHDVVLGMTSPPLISFLGALSARLKGEEFVFWAMDLNPDEAIAAGWLKEQSLAARFFAALLNYSLRRAEKIFVLDRFMKQRICAKGIPEHKIMVIAPWAHDDAVKFDDEGRQAFRSEHGLAEKFVVMYSGNHSPCHPLDTLLEAAVKLAPLDEISFCFVGGGSEQQKVKALIKERNLKNVLCLPYQPLNQLSSSLSAADLQVVVMGDKFAGIVHPCKVYNILAIGSPFLYIGPAESHVGDILARLSSATQAGFAAHGDVDAIVNYILKLANARNGFKPNAASPLAVDFSIETLLPRMVEAIETAHKHSRAVPASVSRSNIHST